jgi:hypothetical protein
MSRKHMAQLRRALTTIGCAGLLVAAAAAQEIPTIMQVEVQDFTGYAANVFDYSKLAKTPGPLTVTPPANFGGYIYLADVVTVNGQPAKGTMVFRTTGIQMSPTPVPGQAIADISRLAIAEFLVEFQKADGNPIGSICTLGLSSGPAPPGSGPGALAGANAIVGGTGAFIGVRGTLSSIKTTLRNTTQAEDPSTRRTLGGGQSTLVFLFWPMLRPEVSVAPSGPEVFHADYSPVTVGKPAQRGETLILHATGLGPTNPNVVPGDPFPANPFAIATSPVEVLVDGKAAPALNQIGIPGSTDTYRVDFQVPVAAAGGNVPLQLSVAWTKGKAVLIPVRP